MCRSGDRLSRPVLSTVGTLHEATVTDQGFQVDLSREGSREHPVPDFKPKSRIYFSLMAAVIVCLLAGAGFGYWLAKAVRGSTDRAPEAIVEQPNTPVTGELMVLERLAVVALEEAKGTVQQGIHDAFRVHAAVAETSSDSENVPVRISSTGGDVRVRVDGDDAERVSQDVYRVHRSHPVEVEFQPFNSPDEDLEISVTPLLNFDFVDPYATEN